MQDESIVTVDESVLDTVWDDDFTTSGEYENTDGADDSANQTTVDESDNQQEQATTEETSTVTEEEKPSTDVFSLKYMNESKEYSREDVVTLAQKGLDYDRIRAERDSVKTERNTMRNHETFLEELAKEAGVSIDEMIDEVRADRLLKKEQEAGRAMTELAAKEQIRREKTARANDNKDATDEQPAEQHTEVPANDAVLKFVQAYPDVQAKDIPQSVWDDVRKGSDLVSAYTKYENKQLRSKLETMQQNEKNKNRSTGSRQSTGGNTNKSVLDTAWDASEF